jgi:hypothetical protein
VRDTTTQNRRLGLKPFSLLAIEETLLFSLKYHQFLAFAYLSQEVEDREFCRSWPLQDDAFELVEEYEKVITHLKFLYSYYLPWVKLISCCVPFQITLWCGLLLRLVIHVFETLAVFAYVQSLPYCSDTLNNDTRFAAYYKIAHLRFRNV